MPLGSSRAIAAFLVALAGCAAVAQDQASAPAAAPAANVTVVTRSAATVTGQPLAPVEVPFEAVISRSALPPGGVLPMHRHPWPRYAYVLQGRLRVSYEQAGLVREFGAGEAVIEAIGEWHEGRVVGDRPVSLIVFDQVPPGRTNVELR